MEDFKYIIIINFYKNYIKMGNTGTGQAKAFGYKVTWKAAKVSDRQKIETFIEAAGFENVKDIVDQNPGLQNFKFPEYAADQEDWLDEMDESVGAEIVEFCEQKEKEMNGGD